MAGFIEVAALVVHRFYSLSQPGTGV
jgi:hypothetical protein